MCLNLSKPIKLKIKVVRFYSKKIKIENYDKKKPPVISPVVFTFIKMNLLYNNLLSFASFITFNFQHINSFCKIA